MKRIFFAIALCVFAAPAWSQAAATSLDADFEEKHRAAMEKNAPDLAFKLSIENGQRQFHMGETIPLEMAFSSARPQTFILDAATYDRSGRMMSESFHLNPSEGLVDPLREYFSTNGFMGGGLHPIPPLLEEKPYLIHLSLGEWRRFHAPGKYRLYITTSRLSRKDREKIGLQTSNIVEFEILPFDAAWAKQTLEEAVIALDATPSPKTDAKQKTHNMAARVLRFLDSEDSAREMARRYARDENFNFYLGLRSSSHPLAIIEEMTRVVHQPDAAIRESYLHAMAWVEVQAKFSRLSNQGFDATSLPAPISHEYLQRKQEALTAARIRFFGELQNATQLKQGRARAVSLATLLVMSGGAAQSAPSRRALLEQVLKVFEELPASNRNRLLESHWNVIADPKLLPVLQRLYAHALTRVLYPGNEETRQAELLLRRIFQLSTQEGRALILKEMQRPKPRVRADALRVLPDETLPTLEIVFARNLENAFSGKGGNGEIAAQMIERYATPGVLQRVKKVYESSDFSENCATQSAVLAYFNRVAPDYAIAKIRQVFHRRKNTNCYRELLSDVATLQMTPQLELLAVGALYDADKYVAANAAKTLEHFASAKAKSALWLRLEKWNAQWRAKWKGREKEFINNWYLDEAENRLGEALRAALVEGQAWLLSASEWKKLEMATSDSARLDLQNKAKSLQSPVDVWVYRSSGERYSIAYFRMETLAQAKTKMAQFPRGAQFNIAVHNVEGDAAWKKRVEAEFKALAKARGYVINSPK